jgi:hypothetical protein
MCETLGKDYAKEIGVKTPFYVDMENRRGEEGKGSICNCSYDEDKKMFRIYVDEVLFRNLWLLDSNSATRFMRHGMAHEMGHAWQREKCGRKTDDGFHNTLYVQSPRAFEHEANRLSQMACGLTHKDMLEAQRRINRKAMIRFGHPLIGERDVKESY